jgi:hypothetical protein
MKKLWPWWLCLLVAAGGCVEPPCPRGHLSLEALVERHNANADQVNRLWARASIRVEFEDGKGRKIVWGPFVPVDSNGLLMLAKPPAATTTASTAPSNTDEEKSDEPARGAASFVIIGKEAGQDLFRLGVDRASGLYYLAYKLGQEAQSWYGRIALAGAPGVTDVRIDPMQLLEILQVTAMPEPESEALPAVVMTLQEKPCAYVVRYVKPQPVTGELKIWREAFFRWDDRQPPLPYQVKLYDADGRCRVVADVGRYRPIETGEKNPPIMPTDIRLVWPAIRCVQPYSMMSLRLSEMSTKNPFSDKAFRFDPQASGPATQVDAMYGSSFTEQTSP